MKKGLQRLLMLLLLVLIPVMCMPQAVSGQTVQAGQTSQTAQAVAKKKAKLRTITNPRLADSSVTLYEGEYHYLKVLPWNHRIWKIQKIEISNKKCIRVEDKRIVTAKFRAKKVSKKAVKVKITVKMRPKYWKKYGKYMSSRTKVLTCKYKVKKLKSYNTKKWTFDKSSFVYDGKAHLPKIKGVPKAVKVKYLTKAQTNAGRYEVRVRFKVPRGYKKVPDKKAYFVIEKAKINVGNVKLEDKTSCYNADENYSLYLDATKLPKNVEILHYLVDEEKEPINYTVNDLGTYKVQPIVRVTNNNYTLVGTIKPAILTVAEHQWQDWSSVSNNNLEHMRKCSECGKEEVGSHEFRPEEIWYEENNEEDGSDTHTEYREQTCEICGFKKKASQNEECVYGSWNYIGNQKDAQYCEKCNREKTRDHQHEAPPSSFQYTKHVPEVNARHKSSGEYECSICRQSVTLTKIEKCVPGEWEYNPEDNSEVRNCIFCNYGLGSKNHMHEEAPEDFICTEFSPNGNRTHNGTGSYRCSICKNDIPVTKNNEACIPGEWHYVGNQKDVKTCILCGFQLESRDHQHEEAPASFQYTQYEPKENNRHEASGSYPCSICRETVTLTNEEDCTAGEWHYAGNQKDIKSCVLCERQLEDRAHQHEEAPESFQFTHYEPKGNDRHEASGSYPCDICREEVTLTNEENCEYTSERYDKTGVNDIHNHIYVCGLCQYEKSVPEDCVPTGELKCIKVGAQPYEYYDCALCGDWCQRKYHTDHIFGEWEKYPSKHIRYCTLCLSEAREEGEHEWEYDPETKMLSCFCGYTKDVSDHDHGHGYLGLNDDGSPKNWNVSLMSLVVEPIWSEIQAANGTKQEMNPNPSVDAWCSRYVARCSTCGEKYYFFNSHMAPNADGTCGRGGCDVIVSDVNQLADGAANAEMRAATGLENESDLMKLHELCEDVDKGLADLNQLHDLYEELKNK